MKSAQGLGLATIVLFTVSFFLPAYGSDRGYGCFFVCWEMLLNPETGSDLVGWFYYSGFVFSNILFPILAVTLLVTKKSRRLGGLVSCILLLHVVSWSILHLIDGGNTGTGNEIRVGYYVWLSAYALLFAAHVIKEPDPAAPGNGATGTLCHAGRHPRAVPEQQR